MVALTWQDLTSFLFSLVDDCWSVFFSVCSSALSYYLSLNNDGHRDAWKELMLLIFNRILKLPDEKVSKT